MAKSQCKFCGISIDWYKDGKKNVPVEMDGSLHECEERKKLKDSFRKIPPRNLPADIVAEYEKKINKERQKKKK